MEPNEIEEQPEEVIIPEEQVKEPSEQKEEETPPVIETASKPSFGLNDKLEGDDVPEDLKGKSVKELMQLVRDNYIPRPVETAKEPESPTREQQMEEIRANFYQDPVGSVAKMVELTIAPLLEEVTNSKVEKVSGGILSLPDYEILKDDINEFMSNVPNHLKANSQSWQIAYERARGKNFDKLVEMRISSKKKEPPATLPSGTGTGVGNNNNSISLTEEQRRVAKAMGIEEREYAKWM